MANIKTHLNNIKGALYGKDVRGSIHDGIDAINKEVENTTGRQVDLENTFDQLVINAGNSNAEIVDARVKNDGTSYSKLGDRLDAVDSQLAHNTNKVAGVFNVKEFTCDDGEYVKGDGKHDDTTGIQKAIDYCSLNGGTLFFPMGTYYITDTINIFKSSTGRHQFRINFNTSQIKTDQEITMVKINKGTDTTYAQGWSVCLDNLNLVGNRTANVGLHINAQGVCINSLYIDQCITGVKSENIYYGTYEGHNIINNCNTGIAIVGDENNAVNFKNLWIVGGARYDEVNSIGIDIQTRCLDLVISDVTIESYAYGIKPTTINYGVSHLTIRNCYFELIKQSYIDLSATTEGHYYICTIDNCHGNEIRSDLVQASVKLGRGTFRVAYNNFKDNYIQLTDITTNVETDMEVILNEDGKKNGWQQVVRKIPNSRLINDINAYDDYSSNIMRIGSQNDMFKVTPAMDIMAKDMTFIEQNSVVIQSPNNSFYRICVNDNGELSTTMLTTQERRMILPTYDTVKMEEILDKNFINNWPYKKVMMYETNLTFHIVDGKLVSKSNYSKGVHPFGDAQYILSTIDIISANKSWGSIYIYNTDINRYYIANGGKWDWAGSVPHKDKTNIRAIGGTSERPSNAIEGLIYYDTDINGYIQWSGSNWINM